MIPAAYAVLNIDAAQHNLEQVRQYAPHAKIMAVIKANGYGHGLLRIAQALKPVDAFAVARVDEGIRLRQAGIKTPITVLEGFTSHEELDALLHYQLDAVVHTACQLAIFAQRPEHSQLSIWLKLDTGMNRLGFKPTEYKAVYEQLQQCPIIKQPINLMTHLANADVKADDTSLAQIKTFTDTVTGLSLDATSKNAYSIANSAGILAWPAAITDWVRPGVMLYGISPFADSSGSQLNLKPIMSLHSRVIAVKQLTKGDKVGYAGTWICPKDTTLGVIAIGYGDGYPRYAKAGTPVLVNGQRVPLIGRVSMDMITVDLGPQPDAKAGDPVTLWGEDLAVEEIALCAETIPYTLVCGITQRVQIVEKSALQTA